MSLRLVLSPKKPLEPVVAAPPERKLTRSQLSKMREEEAKRVAEEKRRALAAGPRPVFLRDHKTLATVSLEALMKRHPGTAIEAVRARTNAFLGDVYVVDASDEMKRPDTDKTDAAIKTAASAIDPTDAENLRLYLKHTAAGSTARSASVTGVSVMPGREESAHKQYLMDGDAGVIIKIYYVDDLPSEFGRRPLSQFLDARLDVVNEVLVGATLNELVDGYEYVVSPHFAYLLDYALGPAVTIKSAPDADPTFKLNAVLEPRDMRAVYAVNELAGMSMLDFLSGKRTRDLAPTTNTLRALLFQLLSACEAAWETHGFVHFDLHANNAMIRLVGPKSRYRDRTWRYVRSAERRHYYLRKEDHANWFLEIIDFGRARLWATPRDELSALSKEKRLRGTAGRHEHSALVQYTTSASARIGIDSITPDPGYPLRMFALEVMRLYALDPAYAPDKPVAAPIYELAHVLGCMLAANVYAQYILPGKEGVPIADTPANARAPMHDTLIKLYADEAAAVDAVFAALEANGIRDDVAHIFLALNTLLATGKTPRLSLWVYNWDGGKLQFFSRDIIALMRARDGAAREANNAGACLSLPAFDMYKGSKRIKDDPVVAVATLTRTARMNDPVRGDAPLPVRVPGVASAVLDQCVSFAADFDALAPSQRAAATLECAFCEKPASVEGAVATLLEGVYFCGDECAHAVSQLCADTGLFHV